VRASFGRQEAMIKGRAPARLFSRIVENDDQSGDEQV